MSLAMKNRCSNNNQQCLKNMSFLKVILSVKEVDRYQRGLIITDDIAVEPILDFDLYRDAIVTIIEKSYPKFTIGILEIGELEKLH